MRPHLTFANLSSALEIVIAQATIERGWRDAEYLGGLAAVPARLLERGEYLLPLNFS
jgi:hypothetical protein